MAWHQDDDREAMKSSPIHVAKTYMKERGMKLGCQLPLDMATRGRDKMFEDEVTWTPPIPNIHVARRGISSNPHPNLDVVGFPISKEVKINKGAYNG